MSLRDPFRFRHVSRLAKGPRNSARVLQFLALESQRSRLPQMAAALSYRTVFGLLPMVVVALVALRFFVSDAQIDQFFNRMLSYAGLEAIIITPDESAFWTEEELRTAAENPSAGDEDTAPTPRVAEGDVPPDAGSISPAEATEDDLGDTIRALIMRAKSIDYRAIGLVGAVMLIYAAISMLTEIERAFNQIFRVPVGKPWRRRLTEYWALLTLGTPCLVATFFVGERAKSIIGNTVEAAGFSSSSTIGLLMSGYAITVLISAVLLLLAYIILPNTRVRLVPALAGALVAAILWEAGKWGFTQYLRYSTNYAKLYGSIALIPLFLLWIYATWAIVLLGLQLTYHIQQARAQRDPATSPVAWNQPPSGVVDPCTAVAVVHAAAKGFLSGRVITLTSIAESTRTQGALVLDLVQRLVETSILNRVSAGDDTQGVALAQPPEQIKVRTVLEIGYEVAGAADEASSAASSVGPDIRARLRQSHLDATGEMTVADLLTPPVPDRSPLPLFDPPGPTSPSGPNKSPAETSARRGANSYAPDRRGDTLGADDAGAAAREQETDQNGRHERDRAPRLGHSPGVL